MINFILIALLFPFQQIYGNKNSVIDTSNSHANDHNNLLQQHDYDPGHLSEQRQQHQSINDGILSRMATTTTAPPASLPLAQWPQMKPSQNIQSNERYNLQLQDNGLGIVDGQNTNRFRRSSKDSMELLPTLNLLRLYICGADLRNCKTDERQVLNNVNYDGRFFFPSFSPRQNVVSPRAGHSVDRAMMQCINQSSVSFIIHRSMRRS